MFMVPRCAGENHYPNGPELTPLKGYNQTWRWCIGERKKVVVTERDRTLSAASYVQNFTLKMGS
jgi:hypothetical protein